MKTSTQDTPKQASPLKILLIGPPGSRKTTLMLQFPDIHVLDCDNNLDGPERFIRQHLNPSLSYSYDSIRYLDDGKPVEIENAYNRVLDTLKHFVVVHPDYAPYKSKRTVGLDSLSHVNEFIIRHVLSLKKSKNLEMEARDWSPFKSYAYLLLVARLEETGKTIICTCHETKLTEADPTNIMTQRVLGYEPFFQGKVGDTIGAFFTDVWRLELRPGPGGVINTILQAQRSPKCEVLKNSVGMPPELDITKGYSAIEPFLKGKV